MKLIAWHRKRQMENLKTTLLFRTLLTVLPILLVSNVAAEEKIIQQEKLSFEKCLQVIMTSQDKLSISAEVKDVSDQKRIAVFTLVDGTLTILCDGIEGKITVLTNTD